MADLKQIQIGDTIYNIEPYTNYLPIAGGNLTGELKLYASSGDSPRLTFQRGELTDTYNDWSIYDSGGYLYIQQRGSGSTAWETRGIFYTYGVDFAGTIYEDGTSLIDKYVTIGTSQTISGLKTFKGNESNDISFVYNGNKTISGYGNHTAIRHALSFPWYNDIYQIGNIRGDSADSLGFGITKGNNELVARFVDTSNAYIGNNKIIHSGNIGSQNVNYATSAGSVAWGNVTGKPSEFTPASHTHTSLNTAFVFNNSDMPQGSDNLSKTAATHKINFYRNGLSIPYQAEDPNDGGILRCRGSSESSAILELGTWDDSGAGETIQFNYYPTTSQVTPTYSVSVPKKSGTIALTNDLNNYLPLSGGTLTGTLGFKSNYLVKPVAEFRTQDNTFTGAITIALPAGISNTMVSMWIDVYNYVTNTSFSVHVGGYTYNNQTWQHNPFAMVYGANHTVRLGHNGTNFVIYIGETNSTWSYPQISVRNVILGYAPVYDNWKKDWGISFVTSFSNVSAEINNYAWTTKNFTPPTSLPASDVYAWAKAATKPSYTKSEVGLGNVDNTADANKNVKYATSAGNADTLDGNHANAFATAGHTHSNYVTTDTTQTISGAKTFSNTITANNWLYVPYIGTKTNKLYIEGPWDGAGQEQPTLTFEDGALKAYNWEDDGESVYESMFDFRFPYGVQMSASGASIYLNGNTNCYLQSTAKGWMVDGSDQYGCIYPAANHNGKIGLPANHFYQGYINYIYSCNIVPIAYNGSSAASNYGAVGTTSNYFGSGAFKTVYRTSESGLSDIRLKQNISNNDLNALEIINNLNIINFQYDDDIKIEAKNKKQKLKAINTMKELPKTKETKELRKELQKIIATPNNEDMITIGVSAQQLQELLPKKYQKTFIQKESTNQYADQLFIRENRLVYLSFKAIQEQQAIIGSLEEKINLLEEKINALEEKMKKEVN